ncbi:MAG: hypothetical protein LBD11_06410 [Candidatus Peribacteria bacterium]|nr:hypothetical protein [Candidatus Peribacteria bacterium]
MTGSVSYSVPTPTNGDVLATVSFVKTGVVVTSTGGTSHLFTGDGTWTFTFQDPAGNTGSAIATVSGIDKIAPTATVINYSTTNPTNGSVTVTLTTSENVSPIAGWTGNTGTSFTKVYDTNAVETIFFYDLVGNQGYTGISIQNITNDKPIGLVSYSPNSATSGNVTAIIQVNKALASTPTGRNATGTNAYYKTYASNTGETLLLTDTAGNTGNVDVTIARIDTTNPTAITVSYDPNSATNGNVTATLTISEPIDTPIGWAKTDATTYTKIFFENTGYTQTFYDLVGNEGSTGIVIDRISTSAITGEISYSTTGATSGNVIATLTTSETVNPIVGWDGTTGTTFTKTFISNANGHVVFQNALGTQGSATYDIDWIDTTAPSASVFYTPSANPQ